MKNEPKISIITVSLNSEKTIERTIQSIIKQAYNHIEYIVVDGGSTDATLDIISKYEAYISKWTSEPDNGISDAFNKGIQSATGDIIGIINSDDYLCDNALSVLAESYDSDTDVYVGSLIYRDEAQNTQYIVKGGVEFNYMTDGASITHASTFVAKKAYERFGLFDLKCKTAMDYDLLLRMKRGGAVFKQIDCPLTVFTMAGVTFSGYTKAKFDEHIYIIRKNGAGKKDVFLYTVKRNLKNMLINLIGRERLTRIRAFISDRTAD